MEENNDIGQRIKQFAKKLGIPLNDLADRLGISNQNLSAYVNNKRLPGALYLIKFLKLGCNINWLLSGHGDILMKNSTFILSENDIIKQLEYKLEDNEVIIRSLIREINQLTSSKQSKPKKLGKDSYGMVADTNEGYK